MRYVLDTNTVSAAMRGDARVLSRLQASNRREVGVPQPVLAELAYGIARLPMSKRRVLLEERYAALADALERVPWTDAVSRSFGSIKAMRDKEGASIEDFDAAIAAHALANGSSLVTRNAKHMRAIDGLLVEDWARD